MLTLTFTLNTDAFLILDSSLSIYVSLSFHLFLNIILLTYPFSILMGTLGNTLLYGCTEHA